MTKARALCLAQAFKDLFLSLCMTTLTVFGTLKLFAKWEKIKSLSGKNPDLTTWNGWVQVFGDLG